MARQRQTVTRERESLPWTHWLLRYIASDDERAFEELVWSVGGSPPYGGVSYEEAAAVYDLLQQFRGPGVAAPHYYQAVERLLGLAPERRDVLALFGCYERIVSAGEKFEAADLEEGRQLADRIGHAGVIAYFQALLAQQESARGNVSAARVYLHQALPVLVELASSDAVYGERTIGTIKNVIVLAAMDGEFAEARGMLEAWTRVGLGAALGEHRRMLGDAPRFPKDFKSLRKRATDLLDKRQILAALEWLSAAAQAARAATMEGELCSLLGDQAFAFRAAGNTARAVALYTEAIALCRKRSDWLNLSRWTQNLAIVYMEGDNADTAEPLYKEAIQAAQNSGSAYQVSTAFGNYVALLQHQERYAEAALAIEKAIASNPGRDFLAERWRQASGDIYRGWGEQLRQEHRVEQAVEKFRKALEFVDLRHKEDQIQAANLHGRLAQLFDQLNELDSARVSARQAVDLFHKLGERDAVRALEGYLHDLDTHEFHI